LINLRLNFQLLVFSAVRHVHLSLGFERRGKNIRKVKSGVWHCPLSILIMDPIYTDTILLEKLGKSVFYSGKEADLRKIGNKKSEAPPC
jgi:hypothetical protein